MGLLDKIESVLPGHTKTEEHTTHTDSTTGEHATSQHPRFGHSLHGLTGSHAHEHTTAPATTIHKEEHAAVPTTATTGPSTTHDSKVVAPASSEHVTTTSATTTPTAPVSSSTTSQTVSGTHTAGTKVDGPSDTIHHTSAALPPLAGSVHTGHPAPYRDIHDTTGVQHGISKHEHDTGGFGHGHQHASTGTDNHKTEHGVAGLINKVTGNSKDHKTETHSGEHATGAHVTEHATTTTAPAATAAQVPSTDIKKHDQVHEGVNFIPNAENPSAIPTAGGRVIGAGQIDHNATGTIGKDYPGDKPSTTSLVTSDHAAAPAAKDATLPDRTAAQVAPGGVPASNTHA